MSYASFVRGAAASALVLVVVHTPAASQSRKLSGPLPSSYVSDVTTFSVAATGRVVYQAREMSPFNALLSTPVESGASVQLEAFSSFGTSASQQEVTPDGSRIVYVANEDRSAVNELYSVPVLGGQPPEKLNQPLASDEDVWTFRIAPDSSHVVYDLHRSNTAEHRLYSVPTEGSQAPVLLSGSQQNQEFAITADSARVVFRGGELFSVPIDGGVPPLRLNTLYVLEFILSPDGTRAVYRTDPDGNDVYELYSVPTDGSAPPVKLNYTLPAGADVWSYRISADSTRVTYVTDSLHVVSILGGTSVLLSPPSFAVVDHAITPDGSKVVYLGYAASPQRLYAVPIDGSAPAVMISGSLIAHGYVTMFRVDAASQRAVFLADAAIDETFELFSAPLDGSAARVRLHPPLAAHGRVQTDFALTPGGRAIFRVDIGSPGACDLYSAPVDGSAAAMRLSNSLPTGGSVESFALDPASDRVLYRGDQDFVDVQELFSVPADGSAPPALRSDIRDNVHVYGGVLEKALVTPDGQRALYHAFEEGGDDLYSVTLGVPPVRVRLDALFVDSTRWNLVMTPDSQRVVYRNDFDDVPEYRRSELCSVPLDGSEQRVQLTPSPHAGDPEADFAVTPDSQRVVYRFSPPAPDGGPAALYSIPTDGNGSPALLGAAPVTSFRISPSSARVAYVNGQELFSVPTAGGDAVKLSGTMVAGGNVASFAINPIGTHVAYVADQDVNDVFEVYVAPIGGNLPAVKISGAMVAGGSVEAARLQISPDSSRVLYMADQDVDGMVELYSVGFGAPPVELSALAATNRDVSWFVISPDSTRVAYIADQDTNDVFELYSAPLNGGSAPIKLSQTPVAGGDAATMRIDPTSTYVVYSGDLVVDEVYELFCVPLDGSSPPIRMNRPLPGGADVDISSFRIDPTGRWVLYHADDFPGVQELFVAALDGQHDVVKVNGEYLGSSPATLDGAFTPDGDRIVYRAPEDYRNVDELWINNELVPRGRPHALRRDF